jgi:hypothetical protein
MTRTDIALPARLIPRVCKILGCSPDDALEAVRALPMSDGALYLTCPNDERLMLALAIPFDHGIAFRVSGIAPPLVQEVAPPRRWMSAVDVLRAVGW